MCSQLKNVHLCNDNFSFCSSNWNERQFAANETASYFLQQQSVAAAKTTTTLVEAWRPQIAFAANNLLQVLMQQNNRREAVLSLQNLCCAELPPVFADANMLIIVLTDHFYIALFSASEQTHCASRAFSACWVIWVSLLTCTLCIDQSLQLQLLNCASDRRISGDGYPAG